MTNGTVKVGSACGTSNFFGNFLMGISEQLTLVRNVCHKIAENCLAYMPLLYKMKKIKPKAIASRLVNATHTLNLTFL